MQTKFMINCYDSMDFQMLAQFLRLQAKKGWMIEKIGVLMKFHRCEPCDRIFTVDFFPNIGYLDGQQIEEAKMYRSLCEASGWTFVCGYMKMQIFYHNAAQDAVPIQTEATIRMKILHQSMWTQYAFELLVGIIGTIVCISVWNSFSLFYYQNDLAFLCLLYLPVMLGFVWFHSLRYYWWMYSCKKAMREQRDLLFGKPLTVKIIRIFNMVSYLSLPILFLLPFLFTPYKVLLLHMNMSFLFPFFGIMAGIFLRWIRTNTNISRDVYSILLSIVFVVLVILLVVIHPFENDNTNVLPDLRENDTVIDCYAEHYPDAVWQNAATSYTFPLQMEAYSNTDYFSYTVARNEHWSQTFYGQKLLEKYQMALFMEETLGMDQQDEARWQIHEKVFSMMELPSEEELLKYFQKLELPAIDEGYLISEHNILFRKGKAVYDIYEENGVLHEESITHKLMQLK